MIDRDFEKLSVKEQALVTVAVLLDGHEASVFLETDAVNGELMKSVAERFATQALELRIPYAGTLLRRALVQLEEQERGEF